MKNEKHPTKGTAKERNGAVSTSNLPQIDMVTACLMSVAALVSGWMSYKGAAEIFNDELMALGFTIVVQGVVSLSLWYFAVARGMQRPLLAVVWVAAVTFSIGTAFVKTDKASDGGLVAGAKVQLSDYEAALQAHILATSASAAEKFQEAEAEEKRGGCGPKCDGFLDEAHALQAKAEFLESTVGAAITASKVARTALPDTADLASVLMIYQELKTGAGELADEIPAPDFINMTSRSAFDRIASAWDRIVNDKEGLDVSTLGAVWVACLMELLAVACAMIRLSSRIAPSEMPFKQRAELAFAWLHDLKNFPERVTLLAKKFNDDWMKENKPKPAASPRSRASNTPKDGFMKSDQDYWQEGLHAQATKSDTPVEILVLTMLEELSAVVKQGEITQKALGKYGAVLTALMHTDAIAHGKNGFVAGEKWAEWISFLFEENRRQRQLKLPPKSLQLRQVA